MTVNTNFNEMTYDQLVEHVEEAIKALRLRSYAAGYEQGKFDALAEGETKPRDGIFRMTPERKAAARARVQAQRQKLRDDIIEMAKRDVRNLEREQDVVFGRYVEFKINREKRTVVALLRGRWSHRIFERGIAKCHPDDCFNAHIGRAIALRRALGLEVPDEYLNAPQPTEVKVGDIVKIYTPVSVYTRKIASITERYCNYDDGGFDAKHIVLNYGKVIDDTREEV